MVSRRNFFTITVIMLVVLFIFQIPEIAKDMWNEYDYNEYEETTDTGLDETSVYIATREDAETTGRFVVYIGDCTDGSTGSTVSQWCLYSKRYIEEYPSIQEYRPDELLPEAVLIDAKYLDVDEDMETLTELTESGINLVFCNLPDIDVIAEHTDLMELLGIRYILLENITANGIRLLDGFLLGGQKDYQLSDEDDESQQDFDLEMPWYVVSSGTKTYMTAILGSDDSSVDNENLPAILWRNSAGNAQVYAVNGDFLEGNTGIGILSAVMTAMNSYDIYPVVNAQSFVVANYPNLSSENEDTMMEKYSQSQKAVYRDVVWPSIVSVIQRNSLKLTCLLTPQMDYTDDAEPEEDLLIYYMKLFQEQGAETGVSGSLGASTDISGKIQQDTDFLSSALSGYTVLSLYQGNMTEAQLEEALAQDLFQNVRTVYTDYDEHEMLISYLDTDITGQSSVNNGYSHTFREDFRLSSIETALGYSSILVDANTVGFPADEEDVWEKLSEQLASYTGTYWKAYEAFESTTLAESDARVRRFLALDYTQVREDDSIRVSIRNFDGEAWFILRTHGESVTEAQGASCEMIEDDAYLIGAYESEVVLKLEETDQYYYDDTWK